ncbi:hypothetical protein Tco_0138814 [Tanacetum coccineum]
MLAERRYPLTKNTLERMMDLRLTDVSDDDNVFDFLRFIEQQIDEFGGQDGSRKTHLLEDKQIPSAWVFDESGDGVATIKQRRHDIHGDGVRDSATALGRGCLKVDLEPSMWRWRQEYKLLWDFSSKVDAGKIFVNFTRGNRCTSSSSIDYTPKSPTSSTSLSTNGYLNSPTSPPPRVPPPPPTQENTSMDITLTLSPITTLDVQFKTPSPSPPIFGHPIPWNLLEAHGDSCLCCIHNRTLIFGLIDELQYMFSYIEHMLSQPPPPNSPPPPSLSPN